MQCTWKEASPPCRVRSRPCDRFLFFHSQFSPRRSDPLHCYHSCENHGRICPWHSLTSDKSCFRIQKVVGNEIYPVTLTIRGGHFYRDAFLERRGLMNPRCVSVWPLVLEGLTTWSWSSHEGQAAPQGPLGHSHPCHRSKEHLWKCRCCLRFMNQSFNVKHQYRIFEPETLFLMEKSPTIKVGFVWCHRR